MLKIYWLFSKMVKRRELTWERQILMKNSSKVQMTHCCPLSPTANRLKNIKLTKSVFHFPRTFQLLHLKLEKTSAILPSSVLHWMSKLINLEFRTCSSSFQIWYKAGKPGLTDFHPLLLIEWCEYLSFGLELSTWRLQLQEPMGSPKETRTGSTTPVPIRNRLT